MVEVAEALSLRRGLIRPCLGRRLSPLLRTGSIGLGTLPVVLVALVVPRHHPVCYLQVHLDLGMPVAPAPAETAAVEVEVT